MAARAWTIPSDETPAAAPAGDADAPALLQYTGGTTGQPKGVILSRAAIATNVFQREAVLPTRHGAETVLCAMPLFHSYGMAMGLFLAASAAATLVVLPRYRPDDVRRRARERVTLFPGSPTIYAGLMAHARFAQTDWSSVRVCYSPAPLAEETLRRWEAAVGAPIYEGYGQTEAGPILTYNGPQGSRAGSVGRPVPGTEVEVVDLETGAKPLLAGQRGEIRARGPQIMQGYLARPEATAESLRDGWLYTGDIGEFAEDGFLYIRDRKKDLVIVGGYNVYPREVDEVLYLHADVAQAAAVGWPDSYRGEVIRAFVVLRHGASADEAALLAHCQANLARYKVPAVIEILDALPCTSANKVDKRRCAPAPDSASGATPGLRHVLARDLGRHPRQLARPADLRVGRHALDRKAPGQAAHQRAIVRQQNGHGHAAQPRRDLLVADGVARLADRRQRAPEGGPVLAKPGRGDGLRAAQIGLADPVMRQEGQQRQRARALE